MLNILQERDEMKKAPYSFKTLWQLEANIEEVFKAIATPTSWPEWWVYVKKVTELSAVESGAGSVHHFEFDTKLPYSLKFTLQNTKKQVPNLLEGRAVGELEGIGRWTLEQQGSMTVVHYLWEVSTNKVWMNLLAPLLRPVFEWNHHQVMRQGAKGLASYLGVRLVGNSQVERR